MDNKKGPVGTIPGYEMSAEVLDLFAKWIKNTESDKKKGLTIIQCGLKATVDRAVMAEAEIQARASSAVAATKLAKEVFIDNTKPNTPKPVIDLAEFSYSYEHPENELMGIVKIQLKGFFATPRKEAVKEKK